MVSGTMCGGSIPFRRTIRKRLDAFQSFFCLQPCFSRQKSLRSAILAAGLIFSALLIQLFARRVFPRQRINLLRFPGISFIRNQNRGPDDKNKRQDKNDDKPRAHAYTPASFCSLHYSLFFRRF
jgi:hypothetical protein